MYVNLNAGYGQAQAGNMPFSTGKTFLLVSASESNVPRMQSLFIPDEDGDVRVFTSATAALAACVAGRGDVIVQSSAFSTAFTAAELLSAETKGVRVFNAGQYDQATGLYTVNRATAALPQTTASAIFTVTGRILLTNVIGTVTTAIQNQANNTKLIANPTSGSDVDICAVTSTANAAVGSKLSITGTLATGLVVSAAGAAIVAQATHLVIEPGTIDLSCAASNTGSVKWMLEYKPLDLGAKVVAA